LLLIVAFTHAYLLAYSIEPSPFEKLTGSQLVKKFPSFYGTRTFISAFTSARHLLHICLLFSYLVAVLWYSSLHQSAYVNKRRKYVIVVD